MAPFPVNFSASTATLFEEARGYIQSRQADFLELQKSYGSPLYVFDPRAAEAGAKEYIAAFTSLPFRHRAAYAVKANPYRGLTKLLERHGIGLDLSSPEEFDRTYSETTPHRIFSGPAKSIEALELVLAKSPSTIVHIDSWGEIERLAAVAQKLKITIGCGVRVYPDSSFAWSKFGVPLSELGELWRCVAKQKGLELKGIQLHRSGNADPSRYEQSIHAIAQVLTDDFSAGERQQVQFIDLGGGFMTGLCEANYEEYASPGLTDAPLFSSAVVRTYHQTKQTPIATYAAAIGKAVSSNLKDLVTCEIWTEPGRVLAGRSMHLLLTIADVKSEQLAIVDGGESMVGWDKYLQRYCPILNVTHMASAERPILLAGSLCDPDDLWGFSCFGSEIACGDVIVLPFQGAYTFSHAKAFIRGIPAVAELADRA